MSSPRYALMWSCNFLCGGGRHFSGICAMAVLAWGVCLFAGASTPDAWADWRRNSKDEKPVEFSCFGATQTLYTKVRMPRLNHPTRTGSGTNAEQLFGVGQVVPHQISPSKHHASIYRFLGLRLRRTRNEIRVKVGSAKYSQIIPQH